MASRKADALCFAVAGSSIVDSVLFCPFSDNRIAIATVSLNQFLRSVYAMCTVLLFMCGERGDHTIPLLAQIGRHHRRIDVTRHRVRDLQRHLTGGGPPHVPSCVGPETVGPALLHLRTRTSGCVGINRIVIPRCLDRWVRRGRGAAETEETKYGECQEKSSRVPWQHVLFNTRYLHGVAPIPPSIMPR